MLGCQFFKLFVKQNIRFRQVSKHQRHFSSIQRVPQYGLDDLHDRSNPGATSNHAQLPGHVPGVKESSFGVLEARLFSNLQGVEVTGSISLGVRFDEQVKVAVSVVEGDGSVGADDFLVIPNGRQLNVLRKIEVRNSFSFFYV